MKCCKRIIYTLGVLAITTSPVAQAKTWMDAFDEIKILYGNETEQGGAINAGFGETLKNIRVVLEDESYQEFFRNALTKEIVTSYKDKTNDPDIFNLPWSGTSDQSIMTSFNVQIPNDFINNAVLSRDKTKKCASFIIRISFNGDRVGYDVVGEYRKERRVDVCTNVDPTPTPSPTTSPTTPFTPSPSATPTNIPSPDPSPTPSDGPISTLGTNNNNQFNSSGSGAIAACSQTILGKGIKTVVMAIPIVGMAPIVFSMASMTSAIFTFDRRRPEHWVKIVDAATGKAIGGAIVNVLTPDGKVRATWKSEDRTGNTGDLLPPGQYEFMVQKTGYTFPSSEEPLFPLQQGEFVYRSGLVNFGKSNINPNA